jgi:hypothetical protein
LGGRTTIGTHQYRHHWFVHTDSGFDANQRLPAAFASWRYADPWRGYWYIGVENLGTNAGGVCLFTFARLHHDRHVQTAADHGRTPQITQSEGVHTHQGLAD